jgi:hypothetical protein
VQRQERVEQTSLSVKISDSRKILIKELARDWSVSVSDVLRRLILHVMDRIFTERNLTMQTILIEYHTNGTKMGKNAAKTYKTTVRLPKADYQRFNDLAEEGSLLPGELLAILVELFFLKFFASDAIWEIRHQPASL